MYAWKKASSLLHEDLHINNHQVTAHTHHHTASYNNIQVHWLLDNYKCTITQTRMFQWLVILGMYWATVIHNHLTVFGFLHIKHPPTLMLPTTHPYITTCGDSECCITLVVKKFCGFISICKTFPVKQFCCVWWTVNAMLNISDYTSHYLIFRFTSSHIAYKQSHAPLYI